MYVSIYVHIHIDTHMYIDIYVHVFSVVNVGRVYMCVHTYRYTYVRRYLCIYICRCQCRLLSIFKSREKTNRSDIFWIETSLHFPNRKSAGMIIFNVFKMPGVGRMGHSPVKINMVGEENPSEQRAHDIRPEQGMKVQSYNPSNMGNWSRKVIDSTSDWPTEQV